MTDSFVVNPLPDGGEFAEGNSAALAWDILHCAAQHRSPDTLDLSSCVHLKPYSIACLCGLGELAKVKGQTIKVIRPTDEPCAQHLARLGLPAFFATDWNCGSSRDTNIVARRVEWPPTNEAERIMEVLAPRSSLASGVFPQMVDGLDEIIRNALTHSNSPIDCIVVGQAFPARSKVEVAVLDLGQTIKGHLCSNPRYAHIATHQAAILKAMEDGVTGTLDGQRNRRGEQNSGAGLPFLREYCDAGGGELTVLSGDAWGTFAGGKPPVWGSIRSIFRGCLVNIRYFTDGNLSGGSDEPIL